MHCPVCKTVQLMMTDRNGIEIDYCPQCRGVWLDRGELDKIIERSAPQVAAPQASPYVPPPAQGRHPQGGEGHYYKKKKREGFLGELFDFD